MPLEHIADESIGKLLAEGVARARRMRKEGAERTREQAVIASIGGHSLRAGFVTSAAERGASAERIMEHTGHQSVAMIRVYTRRSDVFADHAGAGLL